MTFTTAFDRAIRNALVDLDEVLEAGALPDDLHAEVVRGELTLDEARAIMSERAREVA